MAIDTPSGVQLRIRGKVQGVGFRPFVWQLAQQLRLHGDVCNDGDGVVVRLLEEPSQLLPRSIRIARRWRALTALNTRRWYGSAHRRISPFVRAQAVR